MTSPGQFFIRVLKLGATAYGGPAMFGQIKKTAVHQYAWVEEEDFLRGLALCQLIPGATMVQTITYVGYRVGGFWGGLAAAIAFVLPAFIALSALSMIYLRMQTLGFVQALFKGMGAIVVAIILDACMTFGKSILRDRKLVLIAVLSFIGFFFRLNILLVFASAALTALVLRLKADPIHVASKTGSLRSGEAQRDRLFLLLIGFLLCGGLVLSYLFNPLTVPLFLTFAKIGAIAFGGGYPMLSLIQYEAVDRFQWLSTKELLDGIALGQITPGPVLITATFVGYKVLGFLGAVLATVGVFAPCFFILVLLLPYHTRMGEMEKVRRMEKGILGAFLGMLGGVLYHFGRASLVDAPTILLAGAAFVALCKNVRLSYVLLAGGILSVLFFDLLPSLF
jgi:chromate transporter